MGLGTCTASRRCDAGECPLLGFEGEINGCYYCPDEGWYTTNNCWSKAGQRVRLCPCDGVLPSPTSAESKLPPTSGAMSTWESPAASYDPVASPDPPANRSTPAQPIHVTLHLQVDNAFN